MHAWQARHNNSWAAVGFLLLMVALFGISFATHRSEWPQLLGLYGLALIGYFGILRFGQVFLPYLLLFALAVRLPLVIPLPNLSDDFYRFLWDGLLLVKGFNPYLFLPEAWSEGELLHPSQQHLYRSMNSPSYYTVYPPILQAFFALGIKGGGQQLLLASIILKSIVLCFDLLSIAVLQRLWRLKEISAVFLLAFAFHPLLILEGVGNLHFEVVAMTGLAAMIYWMCRGQVKAVYGLAWAAAIKLNPLMLAPIVWRWSGRWMHKHFILATALFIVPWVYFAHPQLLGNVLSSLQLYFQSFEFNAGLYYLFRELAYLWSPYNQIALIGKCSSALIVLFFLAAALGQKTAQHKPAITTMALGYTLYILLASIVHPWYVLSLLVFGAYLRWVYPFVWAAVAFLSYHAYTVHGVHEIWWVLCIEYTILSLAILFDFQRRKRG